jgi:Flp pilus assembly pilin Flp
VANGSAPGMNMRPGRNPSKGLTTMRQRIISIHAIEQGQALVEYALILSLVSLVAVGALSVLGTNVNSALNAVAAGL